MAIVLKTGITKDDPFGNNYDSLYCVVERLDINKNVGRMRIFCDVYRTEADKTAGKKSIENMRFIVTLTSKEEYITNFHNKTENIFKLAYDYVLQKLHTVPGATPEDDPVEELVFKDWESDE